MAWWWWCCIEDCSSRHPCVLVKVFVTTRVAAATSAGLALAGHWLSQVAVFFSVIVIGPANWC
jgi:hypothetical protein